MNYDSLNIQVHDLLNRCEQVTPAGCMIWGGPKNIKGYGILYKNYQQHLAHRLMYTLCKGEIGNLLVCHTCDTRDCIQPDHLFLGTVEENNLDMVAKGRDNWLTGESHGSAKLSQVDIDNIRKSYRAGVSTIELKTKYKVHRSCIYKILKGETWRTIAN